MSSKEKGMEIDEEQAVRDEEFLKDLFDHDGIETPESLSADNIRMKLEQAAGNAAGEDAAGTDMNTCDISDKPVKKTIRKHIWWRYAGIAAAVCACLMAAISPVQDIWKAASEKELTEGVYGLTEFSSYREIEKVLDSLQMPVMIEEDAAESQESFEDGAVMEKGTMDMQTRSAAPGNAVSGTSGNDNTGHSDTYLQVENVDEADIVKCDDEYLYYVDSQNTNIIIRRAKNGKTEAVSKIKATEGQYFRDMFLNDDRLVTVSNYAAGYSKTAVTVYDIADRSKPEKISDYTQSGRSVSQRMVGDIVYLVTDRYAYGKEIPLCGSEGSEKKLEPGDICCVPHPVTPEYTIIGAVDISAGKELSHVTKAVLGGSQDIYSNGENLYVAGFTYLGRKMQRKESEDRFYQPDNWDAGTVVVKVRMADGNVSIDKSAVVRGWIDDQFSMDERNGEFRIATTSEDSHGVRTNNLYVLDKGLKMKGKVSGFAAGESIKAVRYVQDKAYVITYEETDPLFVIDLSDSRDPKIEGEVKIDGFSTLLVPLSGNRILGIGYGTRAVESWQEVSGLKFVIFDVSDPGKPKVVASNTMDGLYSSVQDDHRALVVLGEGEDARFILPCWQEYEEYGVDYDNDVIEDADAGGEDPENEKEGTETGSEWAEESTETVPDEEKTDRGRVLEISASDDVIRTIALNKTECNVDRCPVIGDYIYAVCDNDEVVSFRL